MQGDTNRENTSLARDNVGSLKDTSILTANSMQSSGNIRGMVSPAVISEMSIVSEKEKSFTAIESYPELPNTVVEEDVKHHILTEKAKMNIRPESPGACRDYKIMVREENQFRNRPEWDCSEHCLMRDMIESKRANAFALELLKKKREEHAAARIERDKEIEDLKNEEEAFGASFVYYDMFVKDNIDKRERAFEKIKAEQNIKVDLDEQIALADRKIERLREIKNDMLQCIADRKIFVDFLEDVRALAPVQFSNGVHEIVERFELLVHIRDELADEQAEAVKMMQELSNKMFRITDERTEELINLRNRVTELYCRYDVAKHDALHWESVVNKVEAMTARQSRQLTRVKNACWNLYLQICEQHELPVKLERHEVKEQLAVIENTIILLRRVLFLVKKKRSHDTISESSTNISKINLKKE